MEIMEIIRATLTTASLAPLGSCRRDRRDARR